MNPPVPFRKATPESDDSEARRLLLDLGAPNGWPENERRRVWHRLLERIEQRGGRRRLAAWSAAILTPSLAVMLGLFVVYARAPIATRPLGNETHLIDLPGLGTLTLSADASFRGPTVSDTTGELLLHLDAGKLDAQIDHRSAVRPFAVVTPDAKVVVVGTRFSVDIIGGSSRIAVDQGQVRVEVRERVWLLSAGDRLSTSDEALRALTPEGSKPRALIEDCARGHDSEPQRACYREAAAGSDLDAENALYALGLLEQRSAGRGAEALEAFRAYQRRFPRGLLATEVALATLIELVHQHRDREALDEARRFAVAYPDDSRFSEVLLIRGDLLQRENANVDAADSYRDALAHDLRPSQRADALFHLGLCEAGAGRESRSRAAFSRYLTEFPRGSHAGEVRQRLHR